MKGECGEKAKAYVAKVEAALSKLQLKEEREVRKAEVARAIEHAKRYWLDAKYFLEKGMFAAALASVSYAEGILDAMKILNLIAFEWE